ncbi:unnamed protein product [Bursaphelenchus xylophilus]|uniref:(pine wood nematode) hypothetical protein n=1 Tax=Bursaphelenchus xylophilus TaxID=6326 RepID=A0A1I7SQB1_BURXY|nr:unnamed protein product [Bursaphelenchus xylophilus]CAG9109683.1 unnamed protein product [Bursaphelenchus xylophilus]
MATLTVCNVPQEVVDRVKQFRFAKSKTTDALILKIDKESMTIEVEEELEDVLIEEITQEVPAHQPRFILISFENKIEDGRITYPLCFIFYCPPGCPVELTMLYAGSRNNLVQLCELSKCAEIRDLEDITFEFLANKCA